MKLKCFSRLAAVAAAAGTVMTFPVREAGATSPADAVKWNLDVAEGGCMLTGEIPGTDPVSVSIQTIPGSDSYTLLLTGKEIPRETDDWFPVTLVFGGIDRRFEDRGHSQRLKAGRGNMLLVEGLEPEVIGAFAQSSSIGIEGKLKIAPLALTNTRAASGALRGCVRDQLVEWGADPAQFQPNGKTPEPLMPRREWVPVSEMKRMSIPTVASSFDADFRASVTTDGTVDSCTPINEKMVANVTQIACAAVMNRKLAKPATDPAGKPVRGVVVFGLHTIRRTTTTSISF